MQGAKVFARGSVLLKKAQQGKYAVPAFNTSNLEVTQALFDAAEEMHAPLLIQTTHSAIEYAGLKTIFSLVKSFEENSNVPVCVHLDHGKDAQIAKKCLALGYKSVMIDASRFPFKKNVSITKKVVALARRKGASVEAELGSLGRMGKAALTEPLQAKEFVKKTKVDSLAVAIGTSHGAYKFSGKPKIDLKRLKEIRENVGVPLVLHGASTVPASVVAKANRYGANLKRTAGVPVPQIKKAIKLGICKINIDTDLRLAFDAALREYLAKNPAVFDPRDFLGHAREEVKKTAMEKIRLFGCSGKA